MNNTIPTYNRCIRNLLFHIAPFLLLILTLIHAPQSRALPTTSSHAMISSAHPLASKAGLAMLKRGGNAADAAAATAFVLAVVEPYSSGLGGGGFATIYMNKQLKFIDFREVAPLQAHRTMYMHQGHANREASRDGSLAVAVPGAVAGYLHLQQRYGTLSRQEVIAPALRLARQGFAVTPRYQHYAKSRLALIKKDPHLRQIFLVKKKGLWVAPPLGTQIIQSDLAQTLTQISKHGRKSFYQGSIAQKIVTDMKSRNGLVNLQDLKTYRVIERSPLIGSFRGYGIATAPPPSSGGQILFTILNTMEQKLPGKAWHEPTYFHRLIESSKYAFADRALLGDPAFISGMPQLMKRLLSKKRAVKLSQSIQQRARSAHHIRAGMFIPAIRNAPSDNINSSRDTSNLCVVDNQGNAIALTTTINYSWGAGFVAKGTGIIMNDEMDDFAIAPGIPNVYGIVGSEANTIAPGKRPLSSMSPTIVFNTQSMRNVRLVLGSPGGSRIPTIVAQSILNHLDMQVDIEQAINLGRIHHQHLPDITLFETTALDSATLRSLQKNGHQFKHHSAWGNATAIAIDPDTQMRTGTADRRGEGRALGY